MRKILILSLVFVPLMLQGATPTLPSDKDLKALVFDSLFAFNKGVKDKSFATFHEERLSSAFRKQYPLDKFTSTFQVFLDKNYDISNIAKSDPVFDVPPAIDSDGVLAVKGHYPTKPNRVSFKLGYVYESSAWKILSINVQVVPVVENTGKVPAETELKKLTLDSLLLFNVAIQTKNFTDFYGKIAKLWQKEITPDKLRGIFQSFIDKKINISSIARLEPSFEGTPAVNDDGFLVVKGSYPTEPSQVFFQLKYAYEDEAWKLVGINVEVKPTATKSDKTGKKEKEKDDDDDD
jgi:hypothetical protein